MALVKCKECGEKVSSSAKFCPHCGKKRNPMGCGSLVGAILVVMVIYAVLNNHDDDRSPNTKSQGSILYRLFGSLDNTRSSKVATTGKSVEVPPPNNQPYRATTDQATRSDKSDGIIQIDSDTLINAYRTDEDSANARYQKRLVAVTGVISGVVTIPEEVLMRSRQRGMVADAFFIAMGGPPPFSAQQAMTHSGLMAFFGQKSAPIAGQLARGETVTIVCKCNGKMINAIHLGECALQTPPPAEPVAEGRKDTDARPFLSAPNETSRDGLFIAYDNGTILDTSTNLMWAAKDNGSDINWVNAKTYCENYRGGGYTDWRMPTQDELYGLYDEAKTSKSTYGYDVHLTGLISLTCAFVWASETRGSDAASVNFIDGERCWGRRSQDVNISRVLPVRSAK